MHKTLILAVAFSSLIAGSVRSADDEANLLRNGGFEDANADPWEWFLSGNAKASGILDAAEKHGGESSYHVRNESQTEANVFGALRQVIKNAKPETTYTVTAWAKGSGVSHATVACGAQWDKRVALPKGDFDWTEVRMEYTTKAGETEFPVLFLIEGPAADLWIDDTSVEEIGGRQGAAIFPASTWPDIPAALRFYPVFAQSAAKIPKVTIRTPDSSLRADISLSRNGAFFFTARRS